VVADVLDHGAEDGTVGNDEPAVVGRVERGGEQFDLGEWQ